ncbi:MULTISPECIES: MbeB family mobilization protein [Gammaproteobacteria]|uniref:MbeB family mobilization protein n=1 Tax=Gammaproteobacteria TaxID=1236 RepID=UPI0009D31365|nr:MbeB-like, N-term conserved region [Klebsiella pneumoniae]
MSKILDLAKNFEQTSKQQAQDTEQIVANALKQHEKRLIDLLNENEKAMSTAIREQNSRIRPIILKSWMIVSIAIVTAIALAWGVLTYQSYRINKNFELITQQNLAIQELKDKGANVQFQDCIDKKNRKRLCVLVNKEAGTWKNGSFMVPMGY